MIICGTGHRPSSLGVPDPYSRATFKRLVQTAGAWLDLHPEVTEVISGMALGWDQALAVAALDRGIDVAAYIPHLGQADTWPKAACEDYSALLARCTTRKIITPGGYEPWKMQRRNEAMVDDSAAVLALWNGEAGGTGNCCRYAEKVMKPVFNVWPEFEASGFSFPAGM